MNRASKTTDGMPFSKSFLLDGRIRLAFMVIMTLSTNMQWFHVLQFISRDSASFPILIPVEENL